MQVQFSRHDGARWLHIGEFQMLEESFLDLKARLAAGNEQAAAELFQRYSSRLVRLARSRLVPQLREKVDPEDVAQSVFKSFFARQSEGQIELINWDSLWGLLALFTVRKCARQAEHFQADRRNMAREISVTASPNQSSSGWQLASSEPTAEQAAILSETVSKLMADLTPREREMLTQCLQGYTQEEVAAAVFCSTRTVSRLLDRVRDQLAQMDESLS